MCLQTFAQSLSSQSVLHNSWPWCASPGYLGGQFAAQYVDGTANWHRLRTQILSREIGYHQGLHPSMLYYELDFSECRIFRILRSKFWYSGHRTSQKSHIDTTQPNFLPSHRVTVYIVWQMLLHTVWHLYCPWVSATITHPTCAVSDLHPLLPDLSSHFLQIPGISSIFRSSYSVFWV